MSDRPPDLRVQMDQLAGLARQGLATMLNPETGLYAQKAVVVPGGTRSIGSNPLYSAMSAIGALRDEGDTAHLHVERTLEAVHARASEASSPIGLLGTAIWSLALAGDDRANALLLSLGRRFNASHCSSMELGLVLAAAAALVDATSDQTAPEALAAEASRELLARFSQSARLFRGSARALRPRQLLQQRLTTFASQVYPVHGLAQFARATGSQVPGEAVEAANRLVERQGPRGQWWWVYSTRTSELLEGYPVYSVHQHAMAFMALVPLHNLGLGDYRDALERGLQWIFGRNELGTSLVDEERRLVVRCAQHTGGAADGPMGLSRTRWFKVVVSSWLGRSGGGAELGPHQLEIVPECRPYELGWLLYARSLLSSW